MKKLRFIIFLLMVMPFGDQPVKAADEKTHFEFLRSTYNKHEKGLGDFLIRETETFIRLHSESEFAPEASYLLAQVYLDQGEKDLALAQMMRTLFLFPGSTIQTTVTGEVHRLLNEAGRYRAKADYISQVVDGTFEDSGPAEKRYNYLNFLKQLDEPRLYDRTIDECYRFLADFESDARCEKVQKWLADLWQGKHLYHAAAFSCQKFVMMYPRSESLAEVQIGHARVLYDGLKDHAEAIRILTEVIDNYPESEYAASALFDRAAIKTAKSRDFPGAIDDYRLLVEKFPQHPRAVEALMEIGAITDGRLKDPRNAIKVYDEVAAEYPVDTRGIKALEEAAQLCLRTSDPKGAAERYARIAAQFPDYAESPEMLSRAAGIARDRMKDLHLAVEYLQKIVDQYPSTEHSRKAQERIDKLNAELNK